MGFTLWVAVMLAVVFWCRNALVGIMKAISLLLCTNRVGRPLISDTVYTVWGGIFAGQIFHGLAAGKDFAKKFLWFDDHKAQSRMITKFHG